MSGRSRRVLAVAALLAAAPATADVSGKFQAEGRVIAPKHASAFAVRDPRDPRRPATEVVLSEGAVDAGAAAEALRPHDAIINQPGIGNYVLFWVRPSGEVSMNATFSPSMRQYLDSTRGGLIGGGLKAEISANGVDEVAGRVLTREPVKTMSGGTYELDVSFSTRIVRLAPGSPLGAGGGDPGAALGALHAAIRRKSWPAMRVRISPKALASLEKDYRSADENRDFAIDLLEAWLPKRKMKVASGELRGETAILDVEGESAGGQKALYRVRMIRDGAAWRFDEGTLAGLL